MEDSVFLNRIDYNVRKKINLFEKSLFSYILRSIISGGFLTLTTLAGVALADGIDQVGLYGKPFYAFIFSFGLVYILFLGGELATSNMMYLSAGVYLKKIDIKKALKILLVCIFFNLIGALIIGFMANQTSIISVMPENALLKQIVEIKLNSSNYEVFFSSILANILVNIAIIAFLLIDDGITKTTIVLSAIFMFVLLGMEHIVANFGSFSLVLFSKFSRSINVFELINVLRHWGISFIGNIIGGGGLGLIYAYMNSKNTIYKD